jgi:uncharacterized protein (TIGR02246 family)
MRKIPLSMLALFLFSSVALAEAPKVDPSIAASVKKFNEAFNRRDPKEVASFWAEEGTLISPAGERGNGRAEVAKVYGLDVETILKGTTSTFRIDSVRQLKGDWALLDLDHEIQNARMPDGTTGTMKLHVVILAQKKGAGWQWLDARPYGFLKPPPPGAAGGK